MNTAMTNIADRLNDLMHAPVVAKNSAETASYLDAAGYNYMESRFATDAELYPNRVIVGSETHPAAIDTGWAAVRRHPHVIGDFTWTGWDYLGEAGIGRTVYGQPGSTPAIRSFLGEYPWRTAWCGDIDITGHRRPQSYYREIVFGLRAEPYLAVQRPEHHGEVAAGTPWTWSDAVSSWTWSGHEGAPVDRGGLRRRRRGRAAGERPLVGPPAQRRTAPLPLGVRDGVRARAARGRRLARRSRERPIGPAFRRGAGPARRPGGPFRHRRRPGGPGLRHPQPGRRRGHAPSRLRPPGRGGGRGARRAAGARQRRPGDRGGLQRHRLHHVRWSRPRRRPADGRGTDHRCRHGRRVCAPGGRGRCPLPEWRDLGAALAPLPRPVGPLHVAPRRPTLDRRDRRPRRSRRCREDNALAPCGTRLHGSNPDYEGVYVFTNDLPVFSPDAPEPGPGDDLYRTRRAHGHGRGGLLPPRPHPLPGRPHRRRGDRHRHHLAGADPGAAAAGRRGARADLREPGRRRRHVEPPPALPDLRRLHGLRHHGARGRGGGGARPADRALAAGRRRRAARWTGRASSARATTSSPASRGSRSTPTRCSSCPAGRRRPWSTSTRSSAARWGSSCATSSRHYDALWGFRLPYVLAVHQAPVGDHPHYPFHLELHPPLRAPGLRKYLAGPEVGGGSMTNESDPDDKARELRAAVG